MRKDLACALLLAFLAPSPCFSFSQAPEPQAQPAPVAQGTQPSPAAQPARGPDGTLTLQRTARLVVLDVVVTDAKGNIVTDLKKDDFTVTEAKEPQTVLNFEAAGGRTLSPEININSTAELDRLVPRAPVNIILLDEFNTRFEDMAFARYSLKKFLEKQPDKLSTPTMLIAVDLQKFTVLHDYTQDKKAVIDALDHHFAAFPWQTHQGAWLAERFTTAFATLMRVAQATVGHPGHKNMIWIGRGFPSLNFVNLQVDAASRVENAVQQCVNALRDARVTLYSVDPAGLQVNNTYGSDAEFIDPFGGNYQFSRLAKATGGKALYGRNDVDAEIATGVRDGSSFYTLTYRPTNTNLDPKKFRRIQVTLNRPGLTATTREGYYVQTPPAFVDPTKPSRRLAFDLMNAESSTMTYDGVPLTLTASPTNPDSFTIHVDARGLVWSFATDTEPRHADVIVMATTFDKKGKELKRIARSIKVNASTDVPPTGRLERAVNLVFNLDHDPKATRARFVVRVTASGRIGTADANLGQQASNPTPNSPTP
ncbi:VWA domain-containing protein [Granulicella sp. dw_53]|uniref:VWA domain-containing protein n=1 Tax=Granulicella sp. dw_53 TaxID=2719792 RepID=UPI001BD575B4|nr:VWA domain-containing protein [Granulicella sp. dw_53]